MYVYICALIYMYVNVGMCIYTYKYFSHSETDRRKYITLLKWVNIYQWYYFFKTIINLLFIVLKTKIERSVLSVIKQLVANHGC